MAKPLVKVNIDLSQLGFSIIEGTGNNAGKKYVVALMSDEINVFNGKPQIQSVGWELPNKKGTAPLKLDYAEGLKYSGSEEYPPTIGWANVTTGEQSSQQQNAAPVSDLNPDDLPI